MFERDPREEKALTDYTGLKIGAILLPMLLLFICLGKADMGLTVFIVLGVSIVAIKIRWNLRKHVWWLAHLYVFCKGGDGNGRRSQLLFARASTLALCSTIPSATTAATICISSLAVVIIDKPGWPAHSGAICF